MRFTNLTRGAGIGANCYRLDLPEGTILLDCGMHPEHVGRDATPLFEELDDTVVRSTVLTHAHQDHVGCLPMLQARQHGMPVLMTEGTARISDIMLHNSANVMMRQQQELKLADYPLFGHRGVELSSRMWRHCPLERPLDLDGNRSSSSGETTLTFHDAGHILGSAGVMIRSEGKSFLYTGDVNFEDQTIQTGARFPEEPVDVLLMETTRGDAPMPEGTTRLTEEERLAKAVAAALEKGSSVTIPVFALGKTQEIMALLWRMQRERVIPPIPIYIGGLGSKITAVYDTMASRVSRNLPRLQLMNEVAPYVAGGAEISSLNPRKSAVYALSSGMMTEHTLSNTFARKVLPDPEQHLFFVGYADPSSPGGRVRTAVPGDMVELGPPGPPVPFLCHREIFTLSAHARREDLLSYAIKVRPKTILLVHGDEPAVGWFQRELYAALPGTKILAPPPGQAIEL
jgi:Cft2 family RNA processing exonuclease